MKEPTSQKLKSFDRKARPPRQSLFFLPFIWILCFVITRCQRLKIRKVNMEGLKPPYLVLSNHLGIMDYFVGTIAQFPHRVNYVARLEGFIGKEWLSRHIGCLCKRKFTTDVALVRNIQHVVRQNGDVMMIYPEARYSNVGTASLLPKSMGKLAKFLKVPLVVINMHGNYQHNPIWNTVKRIVPLEAEMTQVLTAEQIKHMTADQINEVIAWHFRYDDYRWQQENHIRIAHKRRAEGLHKVLYYCPHCGQEFTTKSQGHRIFCTACRKGWALSEYGVLEAEAGHTEYPHIPDWYERQRLLVRQEVEEGRYRLDVPVRVEALPNAKGFINLGSGRLLHGKDGFRLEFTENGAPALLELAPLETLSVETEYDYKGKGQCITLSTLDNTYCIFPENGEFNVTKIQFATEELYELAFKQKERKKAEEKEHARELALAVAAESSARAE